MKRFKHSKLWPALLLVLSGGYLAWPWPAQPAEQTTVSEQAMVVDVRTPAEYSGAHYPDAINIPLDELSKRLDELKPFDREIVVYCRSGRRSGMAERILVQHGFTHVTNGGGLSAMGL